MKPKTHKAEPDHVVFCQPIKMKFIPKINKSQPQEPTQSLTPKFLERLQNFIPWRGRSMEKSEETTMNSENMLKKTESQMRDSQKDLQRLVFLQNLNGSAILIGNKNQLDAIGFGSINRQGYVESHYYWSINLKEGIDNVVVDRKKNDNIIITSRNKLHLYRYHNKSIEELPTLFKTITLSEAPRFLYTVKEFIVCFFPNKVEVYGLSEGRKKYLKRFDEIPEFKKLNIQLFTVPPQKDNSFNIIFEGQKYDKESFFVLWSMQLQFTSNDLKLHSPILVYELDKAFRERIKIHNHSKDTFLLNYGFQIIAVKKGYVLDIIRPELQAKYVIFRDETLFHINKKRVQIYNFSIDQSKKPNKIETVSKDCLDFRKKIRNSEIVDDQYIYFGSKQTSTGFVMAYEEKPELNNKANGELEYCLHVTKYISRKDKIQRLFGEEVTAKDELLPEKCYTAEKMGLTIKELYLEVWKRSKREINDIQFLLDTRNYDTIKQEIKKKLKKHSMNLKEVANIESDCFKMLEEQILQPKCKEERIYEYLRCHFFKRKLELLKLLKVHDRKYESLQNNPEQESPRSPRNVEEEQEEEMNPGQSKRKSKKTNILINIQEYYQYQTMDIQLQFLEVVKEFCEKKDQRYLEKIRIFFDIFCFSFRFNYSEILEKIIKVAKNNLLFLLSNMKELLPYIDDPDSTHYDGVFREISPMEWKLSLYNATVYTIDSKDLYFNKIIKSLWFKRNKWTLHDTVTETKEKIIEKHEQLISQKTFYEFICGVFNEVTNKSVQLQIIHFLEEKYYKLPAHLRGKISLYFDLYRYLSRKNLLPRSEEQAKEYKPIGLSYFLKLQDYEIFRMLFDLERKQKGLILHEIKPQCFEKQENGDDLFSQSLLNYFISPISEISDLKYILNRINNKKIEFHEKNQHLYEVLIEALKRKMKIGTKNDIPLSQVLIYVDCLPIKSKQEGSHPALKELKTVAKIGNEAKLFAEAEIDMTLFEIMNMPELLLYKLVEKEIEKTQIMNYSDESNYRAFSEEAYGIIAKITKVSEDIYDNQHGHEIFLLFLFNICKREQFIESAGKLLKDENLKDFYDETTADTLVKFMYKWKIYENRIYRKSEGYIKKLLLILDPQHEIYRYLHSQLELALLFSPKLHYQSFPLSQTVLNIYDLEEIIENLPSDCVEGLDIEKIYEYCNNIQSVIKEKNKDEELQINFITKGQIYKLVIMRLLKMKKLGKCLEYTRILLQLEGDKTNNILYPILLLVELSNELNEENNVALIQILARYFNSPMSFLNIVEDLVTKSRTITQRNEYLNEELKKVQEEGRDGFNVKNELWTDQAKSTLEGGNCNDKFFFLVMQTMKHLQKTKQDFKKFKFSVISIILYNDPYILAELINLNYMITLKAMKSFLSYVVIEGIFKSSAIFELGRRIFWTAYHSRVERIPVECIIHNYRNLSLLTKIDVDFSAINPTKFEQKLRQGAEAFYKKESQFKVSKRCREYQQKKKDFMSLLHAPSADDKASSEYLFNDSDNQNQNEDIFEPIMQRRNKIQFDENQERSKVLSTLKEKKKENIQNLISSVELEERKRYRVKPKESIRKGNIMGIKRQQSYKFEMNQMIVENEKKESRADSYSEYDIKVNPAQTQKQKQVQKEPESLTDIKNKLISQNFTNLQNKVHDYTLSALKGISNNCESLQTIGQELYDCPPEGVNKEEIVYLLIEMNQTYPQLKIKSQILDIYRKAYERQRKHLLAFQISQIFTYDALKTSQTYEDLFKATYLNILNVLDFENVVTTSKIIALIFGPAEYQQTIVIDFLITKLKTEKPKGRNEQNQFYQKIEGITEVLSVSNLIDKMQELLNSVDNVGEKERIKRVLKKKVDQKGTTEEKGSYNTKVRELSARR